MTQPTVLTFEGFQEIFPKIKSLPRYDSTAEEKTPHPWWDVDKAAIHGLLKDISEVTASCINGTEGLDKELQHISNTATKLEQVERGKTVKVALIGAQGAGKSLLINALFDCVGLSLTGAKGFACTSSIVKYAYAPGEKFSAEVKFLNAVMREEMVDEHIRSYVDYFNDLEDSDDEDCGPRTRSSSEDEMDRKRKKTAEDFFDTIFGSRDEFMSAWSSNPVNTEEFKTLCQFKCKEAMDNYDLNAQGVVLVSKSSPEELLKAIKPFLSDVDGEICLWPIVDCVTIRINHPLLQEGLEIIDLPGSGDVNILRARHAENIKDSVDVEIVLGDTARIGTDELVMRTVRNGVLNHGPAHVKVVATKIDVLSEDELEKATGGPYAEVQQLMEQADKDAELAEEESDDAKASQINNYRTYLERHRKCLVIQDRAKHISHKLGTTLEGLSRDGTVEIFHASTSDYMNWIKSSKLSFSKQPAVQAEDTGVPLIRKYLYSLPASQNLKCYEQHIHVCVTAFVDKLKRTVVQSDRDSGFKTIADDFDSLCARLFPELLESAHRNYTRFSQTVMRKVRADTTSYKNSVKAKVQKQWSNMTWFALSKIFKGRGTVIKGTSKAKGLENTINWNEELASITKPGFQLWFERHQEYLELMKEALPLQMEKFFRKVVASINQSQANLITVEKAKLKWKSHQLLALTKLKVMMDEMMAEQHRFFLRITLKDDRENNLIAVLTDPIFEDVLNSTPELKDTPPGKPKRYVTPVTRFRKENLHKHFLNEKSHFVDRLIQLFQDQVEEKMVALLEKHFNRIRVFFKEFSNNMREHAPVDFSIDARGEIIREKLAEKVSYIEAKAEKLRELLPVDPSQDDDSSSMSDFDSEDVAGPVKELQYYMDQVTNQKKKNNSHLRSMGRRDAEPRAKRIKTEYD